MPWLEPFEIEDPLVGKIRGHRVEYVQSWKPGQPVYSEWHVECNGHGYHKAGSTKEQLIEKARKDKRNDPTTLHRTSWELVEVRTVSSRCRTALRYFGTTVRGNEDADHDAIERDLRAALTLVEKWDRP